MTIISDVQRETAAGARLRVRFPGLDSLKRAFKGSAPASRLHASERDLSIRPIARQLPRAETVLKPFHSPSDRRLSRCRRDVAHHRHFRRT